MHDSPPPSPPVTAILAARNESATIADVIRATRAVLPPGSEILVVDDGSRDATAALAEEEGARVIRRTGGAHGKGLALRDGLAAAHGDVLVFLDADGQDPPDDLPRLLAALTPEVDLVNGSKFLGTCLPGALSPLNRVGNRFMSGLVNLLFGLAITDSQSGFRAARRRRVAALPLVAREYEIETEMLLRAALAGLRIVEVPVTRDRRRAGRSGFRRVRNGLRILAWIVALRVGGLGR
ncbi:MAG: glycosyltransferase family 2 protein [bacterium]